MEGAVVECKKYEFADSIAILGKEGAVVECIRKEYICKYTEITSTDQIMLFISLQACFMWPNDILIIYMYRRVLLVFAY